MQFCQTLQGIHDELLELGTVGSTAIAHLYDTTWVARLHAPESCARSARYYRRVAQHLMAGEAAAATK
jgi:hypothetical protein